MARCFRSELTKARLGSRAAPGPAQRSSCCFREGAEAAVPTGAFLLLDSTDEPSLCKPGCGKPAAAACVNGHFASAPLSSHTADGSGDEAPSGSAATAVFPNAGDGSWLALCLPVPNPCCIGTYIVQRVVVSEARITLFLESRHNLDGLPAASRPERTRSRCETNMNDREAGLSEQQQHRDVRGIEFTCNLVLRGNNRASCSVCSFDNPAVTGTGMVSHEDPQYAFGLH